METREALWRLQGPSPRKPPGGLQEASKEAPKRPPRRSSAAQAAKARAKAAEAAEKQQRQQQKQQKEHRDSEDPFVAVCFLKVGLVFVFVFWLHLKC